MLEKGASAPDFKLDDQDGNPISLADFKGKKYCCGFIPKQVPRAVQLKGKNSVMNFKNFKKKIL